MYLLDVKERSLYDINWERELREHFLDELLKKFSKEVSYQMIRKIEKDFLYKSEMPDFFIFFNNEYYGIKSIFSISIEKVDIEELFLTFKSKNKFLLEIFNSFDFKSKLQTNKRKLLDFNTRSVPVFLLNYNDNDIELDLTLYDQFLNNILNDYFVIEAVPEFKRKLQNIYEYEENVIADIIFKHTHYLVYYTGNKIEVKEKDNIGRKLEDIIRESFCNIEFYAGEELISLVWNKFEYGINMSKSLPFKIIKWDVNDDIEAIAELYYEGNRYKFFKMENDRRNMWESEPLPKNIINWLSDYEEIRVEKIELDKQKLKKLSKIYRKFNISKCYFTNIIAPYNNDKIYYFNGEEIESGEELSDEELVIIKIPSLF